MHGKILLKGLKVLLDRDLKIILLAHQNTFVGNSNMISNSAKYFDILANSLSKIILIADHFHNKIIFRFLYSAKFLDFSKIVLCDYSKVDKFHDPILCTRNIHGEKYWINWNSS